MLCVFVTDMFFLFSFFIPRSTPHPPTYPLTQPSPYLPPLMFAPNLSLGPLDIFKKLPEGVGGQLPLWRIPFCSFCCLWPSSPIHTPTHCPHFDLEHCLAKWSVGYPETCAGRTSRWRTGVGVWSKYLCEEESGTTSINSSKCKPKPMYQSLD